MRSRTVHPEINSSKWCYLEGLEYTTEELRVCIVEGIVADTSTPIEVAGKRLDGTYAVDVGLESRRFRVTFPSVITYQVTSESYARVGEHDQRTPGIFTQYSASEFLDFARASTLLTSYHEVMPRGEYHHYALLLLDDIVDVICYGEPQVQRVPEAHSLPSDSGVGG